MRRALLFVFIALWGKTAVADAPYGSGLRGSFHDFSQTQATQVGLCTFCHTPHRGATTRLLWNHKLPAATYSWGDVTQTSGGTPYPTIGPSWAGATKFCLSCHDGTVAIGDLYWWNGQTPAAPLSNDRAPDVVGSAPAMPGNHPVAMPYPYQGVPSTYNGVTTGSQASPGRFRPQPGVPVYSDFGNGDVRAGGTPGRTGIECSSCHDVHNGPQVRYGDLLRGTSEDDLCFKCHVP